ncbi:Golgi-associated RAB2 interactor protein 4 [Ctenodactylus gundi]
MTSACLLPYYTAQSSSETGMFNTAMGKLQRQLHKGEYDIFKYAPIFESDFIQITKRGEVIDVHNRVRMVTVAVACTSPILPLPDVMLLARPATSCEEAWGHGPATKGKKHKATKPLELTRLLPLKFVRISVHDREKQQLRLKFATGRSCYLQLCPPLKMREDLFASWEQLIYLLRPPVDSDSSTYAIPAEDTLRVPTMDDEDRSSLAAVDLQGEGDQDQVSIRSLHTAREVPGGASTAYSGGERTRHDSPRFTPSSNVSTPKIKPTEFAKKSAMAAETEVVAAGALSSAVAKPAGAGQVSASLAGAASVEKGTSQGHLAMAGAGGTSPKGIAMALAGAVSGSSEGISRASASLSPEASMSAGFAGGEDASKMAGKRADGPAVGPCTLALSSESPVRPQGVSQASEDIPKERRERRERPGKDREDSSRSPYSRRRPEGRRKAGGDKVGRRAPSRSLSGHRALRNDKKEKGHRSSRVGRGHSSTHKGISRTAISKESRSSHKSSRNTSTVSSGTPSKRVSRISSFLRSIRANLAAKGGASLRGRDVDAVAEAVEMTHVEAIVETAETGPGLEIVGSVTSEVIESVTLEAH